MNTPADQWGIGLSSAISSMQTLMCSQKPSCLLISSWGLKSIMIQLCGAVSHYRLFVWWLAWRLRARPVALTRRTRHTHTSDSAPEASMLQLRLAPEAHSWDLIKKPFGFPRSPDVSRARRGQGYHLPFLPNWLSYPASLCDSLSLLLPKGVI